MIKCLHSGNLPAIYRSPDARDWTGSFALTEVVTAAIYDAPMRPGDATGSLREAIKPIQLEGKVLWRDHDGPRWLRPHLKLIAEGERWRFGADTDDDNQQITLSWFVAAQRWLSQGRMSETPNEIPAELAEKAKRLAQMTDVEAIAYALAEADRIEQAENLVNSKAANFYEILSDAITSQKISLKAVPTDPRTNAWLSRARGEPPHQSIPADYFELPLVHDLFENCLEADRFSTESQLLGSIFNRIEREKDDMLVKWSDVKVPAESVRLLLSTFRGEQVVEDGRPSTTSIRSAQPSQKTNTCRGRRKGSGSYEHLDKPLLEEMHKLITLGQAVSPEAASRLVAQNAKGAGTFDSKAERLAKRFRASPNFSRNNSD